MSNKQLVGDGSWSATYSDVHIDSADIVARNVTATRWGGADDDQDGGITASGFSTATHPLYLGTSLPMAHAGLESLNGSPIPKLPWHTPVKVYSHKTGKIAYGSLIDLGPGKSTGHGLDMTNALVEALGLSLDDGEYLVGFRVIGGAQYVTAG